MNRRRLAAGYAVAVGVAILGLWTVLVGTGRVQELTTALLEIGYHLVAEFVTALSLLAAGIGRVQGRPWSDRVFTFAIGMLLYTTVNSAGYYAGLGAWEAVAGFGVLTVTTVVVLRWELVETSGGLVDATPDPAT